MSPWRKTFDVAEYLHLSAGSVKGFLATDAAAVVLVDPQTRRPLNMGVTCDAAQEVLDVQVDTGQGPLLAALSAGKVQVVEDVRLHRDHWPRVVEVCERAGILAGVHVPFFDDDGLPAGTVSFGTAETGAPDQHEVTQLKVVSRLITAGLREHAQHSDARERAAQLQTALDSRVRIEQAKGHVARVHGVDPDQAYAGMRQWARSHQMPLRDVVDAVLEASTEQMLECYADYLEQVRKAQG